MSWGANVLLFALGCLLAADTANAILTSILLAPPEQTAQPAPSPAPPTRGWQDRQVILTRNLFHSSLDAPLAEMAPTEDLEPTRLPLTLLGTAAAANPALAWAAIEDRDKRETRIVSIGDRIGGNAQIQRIERRRVVILENGSPRELVLDTDAPKTAAKGVARAQPQPAANRAARRQAAAARRNSRARPSVRRDDVDDAVRNPANILSQARILPKWEDGQMQGVQLDAIKSGSLLEKAGFEDGDIITEINGVTVDSPDQSALLIKELTEAQVIRAVVDRGGQSVSVEFDKDG
jgi:general secretion pathway protein C